MNAVVGDGCLERLDAVWMGCSSLDTRRFWLVHGHSMNLPRCAMQPFLPTSELGPGRDLREVAVTKRHVASKGQVIVPRVLRRLPAPDPT